MVRIGIKGLTESQYRGRNASTGWHQCAERPSEQRKRNERGLATSRERYWFGDQAASTCNRILAYSKKGNHFLVDYRAQLREEDLRLYFVQIEAPGSFRPKTENRPRPYMSGVSPNPNPPQTSVLGGFSLRKRSELRQSKVRPSGNLESSGRCRCRSGRRTWAALPRGGAGRGSRQVVLLPGLKSLRVLLGRVAAPFSCASFRRFESHLRRRTCLPPVTPGSIFRGRRHER